MRTLILGSLILLPVSCVLAQANNPDPTKKIEITFSLSGQEMYQTWCASCHGLNGKGNGPAASALKKTPVDLTLLAKKNGGKFPAERVRTYIEGADAKTTDAHGSRDMPIWGNVFRNIDSSNAAVTYRLFALSTYLETLQAK
jgi:mono/diheme cytochrome c family protein